MQRKRFALLSILCLLVTTPALADHRVGNGGDVVVCPKPTALQLLDFYEGTVRGLHLALPASGDARTLAQSVIASVAALDNDLGSRLQRSLATFDAETTFVPSAALTPIPDTNQAVLPAGCQLQQIAIQRVPEAPGDSRYLISKDLWDQLDVANQAGLILHELIYREAIRLGQVDSVLTRYLTALVTSSRLAMMTPTDFALTLDEIGFHSQHWHDDKTDFAWMLVSWMPTTFAQAQEQCARIGGGYRLPNIRELQGSYDDLLMSPLSSPIVGDNSQLNGVLLWSASVYAASAVPPPAPACAAGEATVKTLFFSANSAPSHITPRCAAAYGPKTLCVAPGGR